MSGSEAQVGKDSEIRTNIRERRWGQRGAHHCGLRALTTLQRQYLKYLQLGSIAQEEEQRPTDSSCLSRLSILARPYRAEEPGAAGAKSLVVLYW